MKTNILLLLTGIIILSYAIFIVYLVRDNQVVKQPVSDLFWIDNNRVHIDSIIDCSPIYDENTLEIIGSWIRVSYGETVIHIECIDTDDYLWWEFKESWLMAFNDGIKERL